MLTFTFPSWQNEKEKEEPHLVTGQEEKRFLSKQPHSDATLGVDMQIRQLDDI